MWKYSVLFLAGCSFSHGQWHDEPQTDDADVVDGEVIVDAAPDAPPMSFQIRVEALIDGRSRLTFKGTTVQWEHFEFAAPGRQAGANVPTKLGTFDWFPVWADKPTAENRDCNCKSDVYMNLPVPIPQVPSTVALTLIQTRKAPTIIQPPIAANGYTLIVELSDLGFAGSSTNIVDIAVNVVP